MRGLNQCLFLLGKYSLKIDNIYMYMFVQFLVCVMAGYRTVKLSRVPRTCVK
jgi:uncharacterized membrane protein YcfT